MKIDVSRQAGTTEYSMVTGKSARWAAERKIVILPKGGEGSMRGKIKN